MTSEGILVIWRFMKKGFMVTIGGGVRVGDPGVELSSFRRQLQGELSSLY